jgi:hypothetical protein
MNFRRSLFVILFILATGAPGWTLSCSNCGAAAADDVKFCGQCGRPFPGVEAPQRSSGTGDSPVKLVAPPSPQTYQVTSYYLLIDGYRVARKSFFWIAEIKNKHARIWCLNEPPIYGLIMGWVKLTDLEKRSTWRSDTTTVCAEPPPPTTQIVVIRDRPYWRSWRSRPILFSWPGKR